MKSALPCTIFIAAALTGSAKAQIKLPRPDLPRVQITEVSNKDAPPKFLKYQVNYLNEGLHNARAKDIIETLAPTVPIIGIEHLPRQRRFEVSDWVNVENDDEILSKLGDKLGLSITRTEATSEFLIVRNLRTPVPPSWTTCRNAARALDEMTPHRKGIGEVDKVDHLYNAYDISMIEFVNFLSDQTTRPIWDQTCLTGAYSFSFRLQPNADVMKLLFDMGFDVFVAKRTTQCIVIAPKTQKK